MRKLETPLQNNFATRSESVTPFLVRFGKVVFLLIQLLMFGLMSTRYKMQIPRWRDPSEVSLNFIQLKLRQLDDERSGVAPTMWRSWETTGVNVSMDLSVNKKRIPILHLEKVQLMNSVNCLMLVLEQLIGSSEEIMEISRNFPC